VSESSVELIVIIMRRSRIRFIRSLTLISSLSARSFTVMPSASVMSFVTGGSDSATGAGDGRSSRRTDLGRPGAGGRYEPGGRLPG
jgi:hypothetical protein